MGSAIRYTGFVLLLLLLMQPNVYAQTPHLKQISLSRGKEAYNVHEIHQDPKGWIWLGSDQGLYRYDGINYEVVQALTRVQARSEEQVEALEQSHQPDPEMKMEHASAQNPLNAAPEAEAVAQPYVRKDRKIGRNEPCWCGSGKKFKQCHGKL